MAKLEEAKSLLEDLNGWDKTELRMLNLDASDYGVNGQTIAYVEGKIEAIGYLGYSVSWDKEKEKYFLCHKPNLENQPGKCRITRFKDPYASDIEFRWRIRVPDGSRINVYYHLGKLPDEGFPEGTKLTKKLPSEPGELVLVVNCRESAKKGVGDLCMALFPRFNDKSLQSQRRLIRSVSTIPWFRESHLVHDLPPFNKTSFFDLSKPFEIMKHWVEDKDGNKIGYVFWIDKDTE